MWTVFKRGTAVLTTTALGAASTTTFVSLPTLHNHHLLSFPLSPPSLVSKRFYNFASHKYVSAFADHIPSVDTTIHRHRAMDYVMQFDSSRWYTDPVCTLLRGEALREGGVEVSTVNAFNEANGRMVLAGPDVVDKVVNHMKSYRPPKLDYRNEVRNIEKDLFESYSGELIGNQTIDFKKQDGVTEIEEAIQASTVERRMNDLLFHEEQDGLVTISRKPAIVGCVSNFSNYLDLCRKVLRNMELSVPTVVLSRNNTTQYMYRWSQILLNLMREHHVDQGMLTFLACDVAQQRRVISLFPDSPLYFTGSRAIAAAIKEVAPNLMASTGGPNTMVATCLNDNIKKSIAISSTIENSGQCTALRHLVLPSSCRKEDIVDIFKQSKMISSPLEALRQNEFAAIIDKTIPHLKDGYQIHPSGLPVAFRLNSDFPSTIDEQWRKVYLDVTLSNEFNNRKFIKKLSKWLMEHQPISLVVNAETYKEAYEIMKELFETTSMVVYSVGSSEGTPALTAQARPQDAEVFGEFPARHEIDRFTKYPVIVPSSTPSYNTFYNEEYLRKSSLVPLPSSLLYCQNLLTQIENSLVRGYLIVLINYLLEACVPREGIGARTSLYGLQAPPRGAHTYLRCEVDTLYDFVALYLLPFFITNARSSVSVSCHPQNGTLLKKMEGLKEVPLVVENEKQFKERMDKEKPWNIISISSKSFAYPLVGQFLSLILPLGHVKSTKQNDQDFLRIFKNSEKWLRVKTV